MEKRKPLVAILFVLIYFESSGQASLSGANVVTTAVPFLTISPDSRASAMGEAGVATTPDVNSQHWNPAKYAFMKIDSVYKIKQNGTILYIKDMGYASTYSHWLRKFVNDIDLAYLVGYKKLDAYQTVSSSLRYLSLGDIIFSSEQAKYMGQQSPFEFAIDLAYTRLLSDKWAGSVAVRYIRSDLTAGQLINGVESHPGYSCAADIAFYYVKSHQVRRNENVFSAGINIQNIGTKISYTNSEIKDFIPTNLKIGAAYTRKSDRNNTFSITADINKLLVPTPPRDTTTYDPGSIIYPGGINSDKSVIGGILASFSDAPGGFKEEIQEISLSVGLEYCLKRSFSLRAGYFYEHENKGNRKFMTAGAGLRLFIFTFDFSYLNPIVRNHPLAYTRRFTVSIIPSHKVKTIKEKKP